MILQRKVRRPRLDEVRGRRRRGWSQATHSEHFQGYGARSRGPSRSWLHSVSILLYSLPMAPTLHPGVVSYRTSLYGPWNKTRSLGPGSPIKLLGFPDHHP